MFLWTAIGQYRFSVLLSYMQFLLKLYYSQHFKVNILEGHEKGYRERNAYLRSPQRITDKTVRIYLDPMYARFYISKLEEWSKIAKISHLHPALPISVSYSSFCFSIVLVHLFIYCLSLCTKLKPCKSRGFASLFTVQFDPRIAPCTLYMLRKYQHNE